MNCRAFSELGPDFLKMRKPFKAKVMLTWFTAIELPKSSIRNPILKSSSARQRKKGEQQKKKEEEEEKKETRKSYWSKLPSLFSVNFEVVILREIATKSDFDQAIFFSLYFFLSLFYIPSFLPFSLLSPPSPLLPLPLSPYIISFLFSSFSLLLSHECNLTAVSIIFLSHLYNVVCGHWLRPPLFSSPLSSSLSSPLSSSLFSLLSFGFQLLLCAASVPQLCVSPWASGMRMENLPGGALERWAGAVGRSCGPEGK